MPSNDCNSFYPKYQAFNDFLFLYLHFRASMKICDSIRTTPDVKFKSPTKRRSNYIENSQTSVILSHEDPPVTIRV